MRAAYYSLIMEFNSWPFVLFFPVVCLIYWCISSQRWRNAFLLAASYYFYMCWNASYGLLLLGSTLISYGVGLRMEHATTPRQRKCLVAVGVVLNLALMAYFKYAAFGVGTWNWLTTTLGVNMQVPLPDILLPVGVSFFVFQSMGYTIDVYRRTVPAERNFINYALFISFFPQLVAGPIERSSNMLPQFRSLRRFNDDQALSGVKLMLWGYFMKLVVADRCGIYVDYVFDMPHPEGHSSLLGVLLFCFQIYGDFAGYTYIAIGSARVMGFHLNDNFRRPFFSSSVTEFWRRWHISLSTWFRDYLYFPLGGNRCTPLRTRFNLMVTFLASGLWHGAMWNFVLWGGVHGVVICIERALGWHKKAFKPWAKCCHTVVTFLFVAYAFLLYRVQDVEKAIVHVKRSLLPSDFTLGDSATRFSLLMILLGIVVVMVKEAVEEWGSALSSRCVCRSDRSLWWRDVAIITLLIVGISWMASPEGGTFVYFQF